MIEELRQKQIEAVRKKKRRRRKRRLIAGICGIAVILFLGILALSDNRHIEITRYELETQKFDTSLKIAVMSDLHSCEFGEKNSELIEMVRAEKPDLIAMAGDMVNKDDDNLTVVRNLCTKLNEIAPVYYSMGNHEGTMMNGRMDSIAIDKVLEEDGIRVLYNESEPLKHDGVEIQIAGISTSEVNYDKWSRDNLEEFWESEDYKIFISHSPTLYYEKMANAEFDLAIAGHFHGGMIRLPGLGGLYHIDTGFFPRYSGGAYELANGTLVVTRGLGNHGAIPRINNKPELVMIEINGSGNLQKAD